MEESSKEDCKNLERIIKDSEEGVPRKFCREEEGREVGGFFLGPGRGGGEREEGRDGGPGEVRGVRGTGERAGLLPVPPSSTSKT